MCKIGVALTTFNRVEYLKRALICYSNQDRKPDYIVVVNNGSSDGTFEYLEEWKNNKESYTKIIVHSENNTGGAGGFSVGMRKLMEVNADWILVSDDDAYPEKDMILKIEEHLKNNNCESVAAICAAVNYRESEISSPHIIRHRKRKGRIYSYRVTEEEYLKTFFEVSTITFVGSVINAKILKKAGLPEEGFFIYHDDSELAIRLSKFGKFICIPSAKIFHDCMNSVEIRGTWKAYYELRNRIIMYKKHYSLIYVLRLVVSQYIKRVSLIAMCVKKYNKEERRLYFSAIKDGLKGQLGLHSVYRPGYKCITK